MSRICCRSVRSFFDRIKNRTMYLLSSSSLLLLLLSSLLLMVL